MTKNDPILIVGAGVFGLSTALELSKRSYSNITVLDRYLPPVPDGSSVDISRVIRMDYADPVYAGMASDALAEWKSKYQEFYRECGFVLAAETPRHPYIEKCKEVLLSMKQSFDEIDQTKESHVPHNQASLKGLSGFYNPTAGWVDAAAAIRHLAHQCSLAGVSFLTGTRGEVVALLRTDKSNDRVDGVRVLSGETIRASRIILATGAWSSRILNLSGRASATSQPVGFLQLSPTEAAELRKQPIVMNLSTGVFCFPPTSDNILKLAQHGHGYETQYPANWDDHTSGSKPTSLISAPPTDYNNLNGGYLPWDADSVLRGGLKLLFPQFADRPWLRQRLCWYTDTPQGDFIVDDHPKIQGLFLATGGSGHAFKFLPILGRHVVDCFEGKAAPSLKQKWAFKESESLEMNGDGSRGGPKKRVLTLMEQAKL